MRRPGPSPRDPGRRAASGPRRAHPPRTPERSRSWYHGVRGRPPGDQDPGPPGMRGDVPSDGDRREGQAAGKQNTSGRREVTPGRVNGLIRAPPSAQHRAANVHTERRLRARLSPACRPRSALSVRRGCAGPSAPRASAAPAADSAGVWLVCRRSPSAGRGACRCRERSGRPVPRSSLIWRARYTARAGRCKATSCSDVSSIRTPRQRAKVHAVGTPKLRGRRCECYHRREPQGQPRRPRFR